MESPLLTYQKNLKNAMVVRKQFTKEFSDFYITGAKRGEKDDLGNTNEETAILRLKKFVPGKIYMFDYTPLYPDELDYYDRKPIILVNNVFRAEGTQNDIVTGINLNFLPEKARAQTLEVFWKNFQKDIELSERKAEQGIVNLAITKILSFFSSWVKVLQVYNGAGGLGYQYAYRNYAVKQMKKVRYVEYQHWEMIPFLNPLPFVGATVADVHKAYWTQKNALNKKKPSGGR